MKTYIPCKIIGAIAFLALIAFGCKKNSDENPCKSKVKPTGKFLLKEIIGDTSFIADTVFRDNYVQMEATESYESVTWKLGSDPRVWSEPSFSLSFSTALGTIPIKFTGNKTPDTNCFPGDNGVYSSTQNLTMVEQLEKPLLTISPLVGKYHGYFADNPVDTFTVRLDYFDSTKYDASVTGSKNFYWLSNIPNGYISTLGWSYPELLYGQPVEMGYKCFAFGASASSIIQGKGWLSHDTLYINYGNNLSGRKKFIGKKY